jgi:tetratricopeptide (TPR) repeat protein
MNYDRFGFPIPPEFTPPADEPGTRGASRSRHAQPAAGPRKRLVVALVLLGLVVPAFFAPAVMPLVREAVITWSLERAVGREARGQVSAAVAELGRAVDWCPDNAMLRCRLLCWRAMLRIENRDPRGALADAAAGLVAAPTSTQPHRVRALAYVMLDEPDEAIAASESAVQAAGAGNPEALNHRAYIRALVGRDLPAALADIDTALGGSDGAAAELLDTRGFILHLLGRHQEAIDQLNLAIDGAVQQQRRLAALVGRADTDEVASRLRSLDHGLAVMHQHRGLACRAAGLERQARQDLEIAEKKGFDPSRGIF